MSTIVIILIAIGAVAFFVLGLSLTLIFKGHNIKSEISENENMKARGIKCVIEEDRELRGGGNNTSLSGCDDINCAGCRDTSCEVK